MMPPPNSTSGKTTQDSSDTLPPIINLSQFLNTDLPLPPSLIEDVFDVGGKLVIGGGSKSYKTWIMADIATSIASGANWLGIGTTKARVLFLNFEIPAPFFQRRLRDVLKAKAADPGTEDFIDVWNLRGHGGDWATLLPKIERRIEGQGYGALLADPAYKLYGNLKENEAAQLGAFFNRTEEMVTKTQVGLALSAHFSKGNQSLKEAIDRISGSGVWGRDPDTFIAVTPHQTPGAFTIDITVRNHPETKAFVVRWEYPLMRLAPTLDPAKLKEPPQPKRMTGKEESASTTVSELYNLLTRRGPFHNVEDFYKAAHGESAVTKREFRAALQPLRSYPNVEVLDGVWVVGR